MTIRLFRAVIIGAPGSGKGTISDRIVKKFAIPHLSSGDLLRKNVSEKTDLGNLAHKYIKDGTLVPDEIIINCIVSEIKKYNNRFLLDGFPRTTVQAENLSRNIDVDCVIHLNVPFNIIIDRLSTRWTHLPSGRVYNIGFNDPKVPFKDDETGEDLLQREDDKPEAIQKRLKLYEGITKPVLEYYNKKNLVHEFRGTTSNEIWTNLKEFLNKQIN